MATVAKPNNTSVEKLSPSTTRAIAPATAGTRKNRATTRLTLPRSIMASNSIVAPMEFMTTSHKVASTTGAVSLMAAVSVNRASANIARGDGALDEVSGDELHARAETLLINRPGAESEEPEYDEGDAGCRDEADATGRRYDDDDAEESERHADPLNFSESLAENRHGRNRGHDRHGADDQGRDAARHAHLHRRVDADEMDALRQQSSDDDI